MLLLLLHAAQRALGFHLVVGEVAIPADPQSQQLLVVQQVFAETARGSGRHRVETRLEVVISASAAASVSAQRVQTAADANQ